MDDANAPSAAPAASVTAGACALSGEPRPYHHGDLRRALVDAAQRVLERDGPQALSLRAVAREAGVSPAAPYHHFKDKNDLLNALAEEGFHGLGDALKAEFEQDPGHHLSTMGLAYVKFARANPALYRVMYDCARNEDAMPSKTHDKKDGGFHLVKEAMIRAGADPADEVGLELACIASWCTAHGVAEMAGFAQFRPLIEQLGGEEAFVRGVLDHISHARSDAAKG
jgi:AcrR family transcriptional regulator